MTIEINERFESDGNDLIRNVVPARGKPYTHVCPKHAFEHVAYAVEELREGITLDKVREATDLRFTQVAVALVFLKERGILLPARKRTSRTASASVFEDAMCEFHALHEERDGASAGGLVDRAAECPKCGESRQDFLVFKDDYSDEVKCTSCGHHYATPIGGERR